MVRKAYSRPFWLIAKLIAKYQSGRMEVLRTILASGEESLPVFGFEDEARMFRELGVSNGWRVRETAAGELTLVLFGPFEGVGWVALDPPPGPDAALVGLVGMGWGDSLASYSKNEETSPLATGSEHGRRQGDVIARRATLERG